MRAILASDAQPVLDGLARGRAFLAFDFDGTLAPIVADREDAHLRPETRRLLRAVALLYPCAVIYGRARADLAQRLDGVPLVGLVGNHGAEAGFGPIDRTLRDRVLAWKHELLIRLDGEPGIDVEDKRYSLAAHYRHAPCRCSARRSVLRAAAALDGARVFGGRAVVNFVPCDAHDKATALSALLRREGARHAFYAGDDRTDEEVFARVDCVGVRVGRTGRSRAPWYVPGQSAVDELLRALITARTRVDGAGERWEGLVRAVTG
jgi:trehalose 6-phosphate phosphatase